MISFAGHFDASGEPLAMQHLSEAQQERLGELLEQYLTALESGLPPSVEALTQACPDLREAFRECVSGLESLHQMAGGDRIATKSVDDEKTLGDFQLHEEIGRGGMGVVYRATQRSLHRTVAIKLLPLASVLDSRRLARFQNEAEAAASLQHPNIVPVHAVGCEKGIHYYAMQFIDGSTMEQGLSDGRVDGWRTAVKQIIQIAEAIHAAHELGVIHRDVKPSNLILDTTGKAWVTDFGLARIQNDVSLTQSGDVIGTMRYMSPEQAHGESANVDGRTDIYSLGATLYELLAGQPANDGEDAPAVLRQLDEPKVQPLKRFRDDLPLDLETVVAKAMAGRRDDRYETGQAFADDLQRVLDGEPTIARPPSFLDHCGRFASKHRRTVSAIALVGTLALAGVSYSNTRLMAEKKISDTNARLAQRNEATTRDAIDRLGSQIAELLGDIPAASSVRHRLLTETLNYYQQLASETDSDIALDFQRSMDLAITHGKIGSFQGELGQSEKAIESLSKSEELFQHLAANSLNDHSLQLQWSISQNNLAMKLAGAGDLQAATQWFGKAIATQQRLPKNEAVTNELATTLNNFGQMLNQSQNVDEAEKVFSRAIEMLAGETHSDSTLRSTIQSNLAGLLAANHPKRATEIARQALASQLEILQADPGDAPTATRVVATLNTLATAQSAGSQYKEAIETLQEALKINKQLRTRWPDQPAYRRDLGISLNQLGLAYSATRQVDLASAAFEAALVQAQALTEIFPSDPEVHSMLGSVLNNAGFLSRRIGDPVAANERFVQAIEHQRRATQLAPQVPRYKAFLKKHQLNLNELGGES